MQLFWSVAVSWTLFSSFSHAATLSLGDIKQYPIPSTEPGTLSGTTITYEAAADPPGAINVFISPDLEAAIKAAIEANCKEINLACTQSIQAIIRNPQTKVEARNVAEIAGVVGPWAGLLGILYPVLHQEPAVAVVPPALRIPPAQVNQAGNLDYNSDVVLDAGGNPPAIIMTIMGPKPTQPPNACVPSSGEDCAVSCQILGALEYCATDCVKKTACGATTGISTVITVPWTAVVAVDAKPTAPVTPPATECDMNDASGLPYNVFQGLFGGFCKEAQGRTSQLAWVVDSSGNQIPILRASVQKRTPPPDPATWIDYHTSLIWTPAEGPGEPCKLSCSDAFGVMANSPCGHIAAQQNIMSRSAKMNVGCGTYSYKIEKLGEKSGQSAPPATPPPLTREPGPGLDSQQCLKPDEYPNHIAVDPTTLTLRAKEACEALPREWRSDSGLWEYPQKDVLGLPNTSALGYHFLVNWVDGCVHPDGKQDSNTPLPDRRDVNCQSLFFNNWQSCNNGGQGGSIQVGCLKYEFRAEAPKPTV